MPLNLIDIHGRPLPVTAAQLRAQPPVVPNPGGTFPPEPSENITDVPYSPPRQPGGAAPPGSQLPQGGREPFATTTDIPRTPPVPLRSTPRSDRLALIDLPGQQMPQGGAPLEGEVMPPARGAPAPAPAQDKGGMSRERAREMLMDMGTLMMQSKSPAERVQGMQMIFEAQQPTPGETATAERERLSGVVDEAPVEDELKDAARTVAKLGGNAELITKTLGLDPESRRAAAQRKNQASEQLDKAYAPQYIEFKTQDVSNMAKNVRQLRDVKALLEQPGMDISGELIGKVPDSVRTLFPAGRRSITAREMTEEVVQSSLRVILGAQFTQKEGEALMARAYNDNLRPEENLLRLQRLTDQIEDAYMDKVRAADYYEQNGTLAGFKGRPFPTLADIEAKAFEDTQSAARTGKDATKRPVQAARPDITNEVLIQRAQDAIARGADPAQVAERMKQWGITPEQIQ